MNWIFWILIAFFVLSLISIGIAAYRYRQYIQAGWVMLKMNRQLKKSSKGQIPDKKPVFDNSPVIRCAACQARVSQSQAKKLKTDYFCSHKCLEKSFAVRN